MFDSASNGWGSASLTITNPDGEVVGTYTLESGTMTRPHFASKITTVQSQRLMITSKSFPMSSNITAVSDADAGFDWPTPGAPVVIQLY